MQAEHEHVKRYREEQEFKQRQIEADPKLKRRQ